jgi:hypothetical protein
LGHSKTDPQKRLVERLLRVGFFDQATHGVGPLSAARHRCQAEGAYHG